MAAASTLALGVGYAWALPDATVEATGSSFGGTGSPSIPAGGSLDFTNHDATSHNLTSVGSFSGGSLFRSGTFSGPANKSVAGVKYLNPGTYDFRCTIHPSTMSGTLTVTGAGTPVTRPSTSSSVRSRRLARVVNTRDLKVKVSAGAGGATSAHFVARVGTHTITRTLTVSIAPNSSKNVTLRLTSAGKRRLKAKLDAGRNAHVRVYGTVSFGKPSRSASKTLSA